MTVDEFGTIPDMLHWYEGMLLLPEHFQAAHRRQEMLGGYLARTVAPHGWGVKALKVQIVDNATIEVLTLEAVMPDGLAIRYRSADADEKGHELKVDLSEEKKKLLKDGEHLTVRLTATVWSDDITMQEGKELGGFDRYRSVKGAPLERDDLDAAKGDAVAEQMRERPWLRPILRLDVGDGGLGLMSAKYVAVPIARIVQNPDSKIVLDRYEPPRPAIADAERLREVAQSVATRLRDKAKFLDEKVQRDRSLPGLPALAAGPALDIQMRQLLRQLQTLQRDADNLRALVRTVPRLEGLMRDGSAHPFTLYLALCDIVGDLAMLGPKLSLPLLPDYKHRDALASFDELERHIRDMLKWLAQRYRILTFDRPEPGKFVLAFTPADLGETLIIGAERAMGESESAVRTWMANAVIATSERLPDLKPRRISGQVREPIDRDDDLDLSPPPLTSLFRINPSAEYINRKGSLLVIENKEPDGPTSILLYAAQLPGPARAK
jgi:type VI secretion system protein ImpJ